MNDPRPVGLRDACLLRTPALDEPSARVHVELPAAARTVVHRIAKGSELGALVVVTAVTCWLVHRYTGRSSIMLEVPAAVADPDPRSTTSGTVALVVALAGLGHRGELLAAVQREIARAHRPVHAAPGGESELLVVPSSLADRARPSPRHDLYITVELGAIELRSPQGRLPRWFLADFADHLVALVESLADLHRPLATFEDVMRRRCLAQVRGFNETDRPLPAGATVLDELAEHVRVHPEATAVICGARSLSYAQLDREARALAARLQTQLGVARGQVVAALHTRSERAIVSVLGILAAGAVYLPLNRKAPAAAMRRMLEESRAVGVVVSSELHDIARERIAAHALVIVDALDAGAEAPAPPSPARPTPDDAAYIIYTSGTTGVPKGVKLAHEGLLNTALDHVDRLQVTPQDRYLQFMALSFDGFLLDVFTTLCAGATLVIADDATIADPSRLMQLIEEQHVTLSTITPSYLRLLDPARLSSLRALVSAGEILGEELARDLAERLALYNGYGPTEATINATLHRITPDRCTPPLPIGRPSANKQLYVVDEHLEPQPLGVVGELCIAGMGLAIGYLGPPRSGEPDLVDNPFGPGQLYRTGDFGAWGPDGALLFKGRVDHQIKLNGYRIDLREIQAALASHPNVGTAEVLLHAPAPGHATLLAFHQPRGPRPTEPAALHDHLARLLPEYMQPHQFVPTDPWPLTPHGKTDGAALLASWSSGTQHHGMPPSPPSTPTERMLCAIWSEVLGVSEPGVHQSFLALGGDSIRLIQVVHRARQQGLRLEVADVLAKRTIASLAAQLERAGSVPVDAARERDSLPLHLLELSPADRAVVPPHVEDAHPAALMQTFMIERYAKDRERNGIYLGCAEWRLAEPELCERSMCEALQRLYDAHPSLRQSFVRAPSGQDLRLVRRSSPLDIHRADLRARSRSECEAFFTARIEREASERFDPYSPEPLVRFELYRTDEGCSLFISFHHALLDGWSGIELRNRLLEHYLDAKAGRPAPETRAQPDSYREFVALERAVLADPAARCYWESQAAAPSTQAALDDLGRALSSRRKGPPVHGSTQQELPPALVEALLAHRKRSATSVKALLLSSAAQAIMSVLHLDQLVLGVITNGRAAALTDPFRSTGLFWNIVPITISRTQAASVAHVQQRLDELTPFGHFPWKAIEEEIARRELLVPIFNFVNFHNTSVGALRLAEGVVQSRFHAPLTFFIKLYRANSKPSAFLRLGFDRALLHEADAQIMRSTTYQAISTTVGNET